MRTAFKYRIYPNDEQQKQLARMFGCCRFVYNKTLAYRKEHAESHHRILTVNDCIHYCKQVLIPENPWLVDVDEYALIQAIHHMDLAWRQAFHSHGGYPSFKCRHDSHKSYTTTPHGKDISIDFEKQTITLPMLSSMKATLHRTFTGPILWATISQAWSGKYYVSLVADVAHQDMPLTQNRVGLNLRNNNVCITSDGKEYVYSPTSDKHTRRLTKLQKQLTHKEKGSSNYYKLKKEIALCHERITNTKTDALQKASHQIIRENQVIVFEQIRTNDSGRYSSSSLNEFQKLVEYKAKRNHRRFIKVDPRTIGRSSLSQISDHLPSQDIARRILTVGLKQT